MAMNRGLRKELALLTGLASLGLLLLNKKPLAAALGLGAVAVGLWPVTPKSFRNRSVIITGGSRGLGLALAEEFLREGAFVTLLARDTQELEKAQNILDQIPEGQVYTIGCDVTQPEALAHAFEHVESRFGRIDVLVNNAGTITVGPFETMEQPDFDALVELQLNAVIHAVQLAVPAFRRVGEGRIINISSIGGAVPVPHMSTYCTGKFAMAGFSETIAAELAPDNIKVTTVYPGLMRTGSPIQAVFKGNHEKEYAWFTTGDVAPGISVNANRAAKLIIEGSRNGDARVAFPWVTKLGILGHAVLPETYAFIMRQAARTLPKSSSKVRKTGAQSKGWLERQLWFRPLGKTLHKAESELNQVEKYDANFNLGLTSEPAPQLTSP